MAGTPNRSKSKRKPTVRTQNRRRFKDRDRNFAHGRIVDYKELDVLRRLLTSSGKILSRKRAGTSQMEQRDVRLAVKRARFMALLPYIGM